MKKKLKPMKLSTEERTQVDARKLIGHDNTLVLDERGRHRLPKGTADAERRYDVSSGNVARVRRVDPLKGILSLTPKERDAGKRYGEDFELASTEGLKTSAYNEKVDIIGPSGISVAAHLIDNHKALARAREAVGYEEIIIVLDAVCGLGMSLSEVAAEKQVERAIVAQLLRMGLGKLALHYSQNTSKRDRVR